MTSATASKAERPVPAVAQRSAAAPPLISPVGWAWIAALGVLFVMLFRNFLWRMFYIATNADGSGFFDRIWDAVATPWNPDWSHALIVPFISGYAVYQKREQLAAIEPRVCWAGLLVLFVGMFGFAWWIFPGRNDMFQGYFMLVSLFGLLLFLLGPKMMRHLWFPVAFLGFGVKVSDAKWERLANILQDVAARASTVTLEVLGYFLGFDVSNAGSRIDLLFWSNGQYITDGFNVAEACSGLRSLMAFLALAAAIAFLMDRAWWQRLVLLLVAVPVAVGVNVCRVTVLGILFTIDKQLAQGSFHTLVGMFMLVPAAALFLLIGWVLDKVVIEEEVEPQRAAIGPIATVLPVTPPVSPRPITRSRGVFGLIAGAAMTLLLGLAYALGLSTIRPDLAVSILPDAAANSSLAQSKGLYLALFVLAVVAVALIVWRVRRSVSGHDPGRTSVRVNPVPLAIALGVLLAATSGLSAVVMMTKVILIKESIPLRKPLYFIDSRIGRWEMVAEDPPLTAEMIESLGTTQYVSRLYRDTTAADESQPGTLVKLHVAYYTGKPDTVPHVPDRCYVAGGMMPRGLSSTTLKLGGPRYEPAQGEGWIAHSRLEPKRVFMPRLDVPATVFTYVRPGTTDKNSNVVYFFVANGKFLASPDMVRLQGFDPRDRYSYYCKVEVGVHDVSDSDEAARRASEFLSAVMPEVMACLPAWPAEKFSASGPSQIAQRIGPMH